MRLTYKRVGLTMPIVDFQLPIRFIAERAIDNRQLAIGNDKAHPLPRGGTDLIGPIHYVTARQAPLPRGDTDLVGPYRFSLTLRC